jgi:hypothetical protein
MRLKSCAFCINTVIPHDSRRNLKERETVLQVRYAPFAVKKPPQGIEPIAWFLMTNEPVLED